MAGRHPIERFTSQRFVPQGHDAPFACPIRKTALADSLDGAEQALREAGAVTRAEDLGIDPAFYRGTVLHAHEGRERYAMLDLADDAGLLEAFVVGC